jgi:hypothetical protein
MDTDAFTERLSAYIDDELDLPDRAAVDAHLGGCLACRTTLAELRAVVARAASLEDSAPGRDLWAGIAARLVRPANRASAGVRLRRLLSSRRFSFTLPQLAAASLALMVLSGSLVWIARSGDPRADFQPVGAHNAVPARDPGAMMDNFVDAQYDRAIADLERKFERERTKLDPATIDVLEQNLRTIDLAIEEVRRALIADPGNVYLNTHLARARQGKLALLRIANHSSLNP